MGGTRATFEGPDSVAVVDAAMADFERRIEAGCTTLCMKPSQHTDDPAEVRSPCRYMVAHVSRWDVRDL